MAKESIENFDIWEKSMLKASKHFMEEYAELECDKLNDKLRKIKLYDNICFGYFYAMSRTLKYFLDNVPKEDRKHIKKSQIASTLRLMELSIMNHSKEIFTIN